MTRKIVVSYQPSFIPVLKGMVKNNPDTMIYPMHGDFARQLKDIGLPVTPLGGDMTVDVRGSAYSAAAQVIAHVHGKEVPDDLVPVAEPVKNWMRDGYSAFIYPRLSELIPLVLVIDQTKPDLVLLHNDVEPAMRAAAMWAKSHGVPCFHVPHAVYVDNVDRTPPGTDIHDIVTASYIAAAGPYQLEWYRARGGNAAMTGLPQFDKWAKMPVDRKRARTLLNLDADLAHHVVTFASSWRQDTNLLGCHDGLEEAYTAFLQMAKRAPEMQYIVKLHPRGNNADWHAKLAEEMGVRLAITPNHLEAVVQATDLLISYGPSGVLYEAAHLNHLRLACTGGFEQDSEVIKMLPNADDMFNKTLMALSTLPVDASRFAYKYAGAPDGRSTERVIAITESLCQQSFK